MEISTAGRAEPNFEDMLIPLSMGEAAQKLGVSPEGLARVLLGGRWRDAVEQGD